MCGVGGDECRCGVNGVWGVVVLVVVLVVVVVLVLLPCETMGKTGWVVTAIDPLLDGRPALWWGAIGG